MCSALRATFSLTHPTPVALRRVLCQERAFSVLYLPKGVARLAFIARVERGPSEGARSASTDPITPSKLARYHFKRVAWIDPQLRTSNDHSFIVGVP